MIQQLIDFLIQIPYTFAEFTNWLITPINESYLNISPLGLLGVSGVSVIIVIIGVHVVKLFIDW